MKLKPFFSFYGGKYRAAPFYPKPLHDTIIEPFAGSAGYSVRYPGHNVILLDKDPVIIGVWNFLIRASESEILSLPFLSLDQTVDDLNVCEEARHLIGFWIVKGATHPNKKPSAWMREGIYSSYFWGPTIRQRIANQVGYIRHWRSIEGSYDSAPSIKATWFIDPPYQKAGKYYRCGSRNLNFNHISEWAQKRDGQVLVCENEGASWLPFEPFRTVKSMESRTGGKTSKEVLWLK